MLTDETGPASAPGHAGTHCPSCWSPSAPGTSFCPACGVWLAGPVARELLWIEDELQRLETARLWLFERRALLLDQLTAGPGADSAAPHAVTSRPTAALPSQATKADGGPRHPRPEISGRQAARLLLAAGALLLVIAATIFTIAGWSRLGDLGRAAILIAVTAILLGVAPRLRRRGLAATAETLAGIGLILTLADGYLAVRIAGLPWPGGGLFAAAAVTAVLAGVWAGYGKVSELRLPRVAAIWVAQLPAVLAAAGLSSVAGAGRWFPPAAPAGFALIADAAVSLTLARRLGRTPGSARHTSRTPDAVRPHASEPESGLRVLVRAAVTCWVLGVLAAVTVLAGHTLTAGAAAMGWPVRGWTAATMIAAAAVGIAGPHADRASGGLVRPAALLSGALLAVGSAVLLLAVVPAGWGLGVLGGCGWAVSAAALTAQPGARRFRKPESTTTTTSKTAGRSDLVAAGGAAMLALTAVLAIPVALTSLVGAATSRSGSRGLIVAGPPNFPGSQTAALVLALTALVFWFAPQSSRPDRVRVLRPAGIGAAALAVAGIPAAVPLGGWAVVTLLTAGAAVLLAGSVKLGEPVQAGSAVCAGTALAAGGAAASLATPDRAVTELAVLTVMFAVAATWTRRAFVAAVCTAAGLASAAGLAWTAALAAGWPAAKAAFAGLAVAVAAAAAATWLRPPAGRSQRRNFDRGADGRTGDRAGSRVRADVLDIGAVVIAATSLIASAADHDTFTLISVTAAFAASATAWRRSGGEKTIALAVACTAVAAGLAAQTGPLTAALLAPARVAALAWRGHAAMAAGAVHPSGLRFAVILAACGVAALTSAAGAARGRRLSLDVIAVGLSLLALPASEACGLGYWPAAALMLALTLGLAAWAAAAHGTGPAVAALLGAALTLAWCMAAPLPTVLALGIITAGCLYIAQRARLASVANIAAWLALPAAATLAATSVLAVGGAWWQAVLAVFDVALIALRLDLRKPGWALLAGLAMAWCAALAAMGAIAPEPYTAPVALAVLAIARERGREIQPEIRPSSWLTWGPSLALGLLPSLVMCWLTTGWLAAGWIRPVALAGVAAAVAIAGGRARMQAPLLAGATVAVLAATRELVPVAMRVIGVLPGWVPVAVIGAVLLWAGATYEARLRNLRAIRSSLGAMN